MPSPSSAPSRARALAQPGDQLAAAQRPRHIGIAETQILRPRDFALSHRDAAAKLGEIIPKADREDQKLRLAQFTGSGEALRPIRRNCRSAAT